MVRGPEQQQVGLLRSGMGLQDLWKLKLQVTLESTLLNWSIIWFQVFSKQSMHNQQENITAGVDLEQYHQLWFCRCSRNKVACKLVAYQGDGHRLRECRLQSRQSRKLIANLLNTESWELSTLEYIVHFSWETGKPSNLATYLPCEFSMDVPRPETTQHRDTQHWSSVNTGRKQQDARDLFKLQQIPNLCELYTELYNMQQQSSHVQNKLHDV
jgi:hypothetical protein